MQYAIIETTDSSVFRNTSKLISITGRRNNMDEGKISSTKLAHNVCNIYGAENWWLRGRRPLTYRERGYTTFLDGADLVCYEPEESEPSSDEGLIDLKKCFGRNK